MVLTFNNKKHCQTDKIIYYETLQLPNNFRNNLRDITKTANTFKYLLLCYWVLVIFCLFTEPVSSCSSFKTKSKIELDKNGYTNILIAIDENVPENHDLIDRIKTTFTDASKLLFNVTK